MKIGQLDSGEIVSIDEKRVATAGTAILAMRGAGKSWLNAVMAEGLLKGGFPIVIVDPEGEYWTLKVIFGEIAVAGGEHADLPISTEISKELAHVVVENRVPLVLDLSDMRRLQQFAFLSSFLEELFFLETDARVPMWISLEEADLWIPQRTETPCKGAVLDICQRGRKRGLGFCLVTQRPATIDKTALSQAEYRFFKRFQQPHDLSAVSDYLGPYSRLSSTLPNLPSNSAVVYAPTEFEKPVQIAVAKRLSPHGGATPEQIARVKSSPTISSLRDRLELMVRKRQEEKSQGEILRDRISALEKELISRKEELERTKAALELAATLKFASVKEHSKIRSGSGHLDLEIEGIDQRTGRVIGNSLAQLVANELSPVERAVYLSLLMSENPLNNKDLSTLIDHSNGRIAIALKRLQRKNLVNRARTFGRGKFYLANKIS